jgi:hypothetical protein
VIGVFFVLGTMAPLEVQVLLLADNSKSCQAQLHEDKRAIDRQALLKVRWDKRMSMALSFKVRHVDTLVLILAAHKKQP